MFQQRYLAKFVNLADHSRLKSDPNAPPRVPIFGNATLTHKPWNLSHSSSFAEFVLENNDLRQLIVDVKANPTSIYFIQNATSDHLRSCGDAAGFAVNSATRLVVEYGVVSERSLSCRIWVMFYNSSGARIRVVKVPPNIVREFRPPPEASRAIVALSFGGTGNAVISGVRLDDAGIVEPGSDPLTPIFGKIAASKLAGARSGGGSARASDRLLSGHASAVIRSGSGQGDNALAYKILVEQASMVPKSNGCRYYSRIPLSVGIIADIYMFNFYKDAFSDAMYLSPRNYEEALSTSTLDAFIYTTCWSGLHNDEWRGVTYRETPRQALSAILEHCRRRDIPTIFQSIEDPSNFEHFLPLAREFDWVFTSDADLIDRYRRELGHQRIVYGEYGANPLLNNPIGSRRPAVNGAFFAGSYPARYPERCHDMEVLFDSLIGADVLLVIADRNFATTDATIAYPDKYGPNIIEKFDHALLQSVHKLFRYSLNFNSIKSSSTMCAMRVYELQAQACEILSNYARSVYNRFPGIQLIPDRADLVPYFATDEARLWDEYRRNIDNARAVLTSRTSFDVIGRMLGCIGMTVPDKPKTVVVIIEQGSDGEAARAFERQRYPAKLLVNAEQATDRESWANILAKEDVGYFTYFSPENRYEAYYLTDLVNAFKYTSCGFVTKGAGFSSDRFIDGPQHEYTAVMAGRMRSLFSAEEHSPSELARLLPDQPAHLAGGYSIYPFSLNEPRREAHRHLPPAAYRLSVIVPVFNNGTFLRARCMESLKRSNSWKDTEILLIDDGSTDGETAEIVRELGLQLPNIRTHFFPRGGSGSASRARNAGIELASAPLISFLDPDNEISPGGYDALLRIHMQVSGEDGSLGFVSGYQVKVGERNTTTGRHTSQDVSVIEDLPKHFFSRGLFPVVSTQAAVMSRDLFGDGGLRFVEGAAGQDTLFGWELLARAGRGAFTASAFLLYYFERAGSVTNTVDAAYFEKKLVLELAQRRRLEELGLLSAYMTSHFDAFFRDWYLKKFEAVPAEDVERSTTILRQILALYGVDPDQYKFAREIA